MSTRKQQLDRHQAALDARKRLESGTYTQDQGPYKSTRLKMLEDYNAERAPLPSSFSGDPETSMLNVPNAIDRFQAARTTPDFLQAKPSAPDVNGIPRNMIGSAQALQSFSRSMPPPDLRSNNEKLGDKAKDIPIIGGIVKGLDWLSEKTKPAADIAQEYYTPGAGASVLGAADRAGMNLVGRLLPKLETAAFKASPQAAAVVNQYGPLAGRIATEAGIGAVTGGGQMLAAHPEEGFKGAAEGALGGAVAGGAFPIVGKGVGNAFAKLFKRSGMPEDVATKEVEKVLALPLGREDAARLRRAPQGGVNDTIADPYTFGLPSPKTAEPVATSARIAQRANPWREKYNQLIGMAHETKFTPGRELEELDQLWSSIASKEDPSLDELIKLAHPTYFNKLEPGLVSKAKNYQAAREVAGAPLPIKGTEQVPQGAIAEAAPITQKVGRKTLEPQALKSQPAPEPQLQGFEPQLKRQETSPKPLEANPFEQKKPTSATKEEDIVDDLTPDEPDEVSVRVRDKLNSFADEMLANAKAELAKNRNRLSSNPADVYGQYAKMGAAYMLKGSVKLADLTEAMVKDFGEDIRPHVRKFFKKAKEEYKLARTSIERQELGLYELPTGDLKDLSNINLNTADVYRNFQKVFGKHYDSVKKSILDPFDEAKGSYATEQVTLTDKLYKDVVKGLGIKKGSKESALVQKYGERMMDSGFKELFDEGKLSREMLNEMNLEKLKEQAPNNWQKIVKADKWFRDEYDGLIDRVNETVAKIYPNKPEKLVPKRSDYYRHFQELKGWSGLKNLFDSTSAKISPSLSGVSPFTQPKSKWASFKQQRGLGEFKNDAVGGFLEYVPAASYAIHIDPHIATFRNLGKRLAADTEKTANINNFIKFLHNYANDLSGKTSPFDRWVEEIGGRKTLQVLTWANNRVKSNVILGSVRSTLAQSANIPQGIAFAKHHSAEGAIQTLASVFRPNEAMDKSIFLRERFLDQNFRRFDTKLLEQPRRFAEWMMETSDRIGTSFVWNSAYAKGKALKVADPVKYADENTRRLVAGRGIGEVPLLQKSKVFQVIAPFQLEVGNLWRVMKDFVDAKDFVGIATLFTANFLLNKAMEKATGSGVTFDPIQAVREATEEDLNPLERVGRVGGEVLSNVPLGQTVASAYPEFGTSMFGVKLPTRKKLFGDNDPTRFGGGLVVVKGAQDPIFKMLPSFGGNQLKKTITGADALIRGGAYKENVLTSGLELNKKELKYKVDKSPKEITRSLLFGPTATGSGQEYYNEERRPLSEKQTEQNLRSPDPDAFYGNLMKQREIDTNKRKISEIQKDKTKSTDLKRKEVGKLQDKINKISSSVN